MAISTIPTLKANLKTRLEARPGLAGVQVTVGAPLPNPQREYMAITSTRGRQVAAALGAQRREETYTVAVEISVLREGIDMKTTEERAFALMAELENELRTDATVNNAVRTAEIGEFELSERASPDGMAREAVLTVQVGCAARI